MMLLDATPPPPVAMRCLDPADDEHGQTIWSPGDTALVALSLFTIWAARTGRVLRDVPISELTPEELIEFWADDQLEEQYATPARQRQQP
jgi:hypothetical protein